MAEPGRCNPGGFAVDAPSPAEELLGQGLSYSALVQQLRITAPSGLGHCLYYG